MNAELEAIRDAWDKNTGDGRDESARELADEYVVAHEDQFASLKNMTLDQCVQAVDVFRQAGMEEEQWRVETWLLHRYEPQNIGGVADAKVRLFANG